MGGGVAFEPGVDEYDIIGVEDTGIECLQVLVRSRCTPVVIRLGEGMSRTVFGAAEAANGNEMSSSHW